MDIRTYLKNLNTTEEVFGDVYQYGMDHHVPIIDADALNVLKHLIQISRAKSYLEIGTAIGYSGLHMLSVFDDSVLTTIEADEDKHRVAAANFSKYDMSGRVNAILDDAKTVELPADEASFDLLFIDASKGSNQLFMDRYMKYIKKGGLIIVDNILLRGDIVNDDITHRNRRRLRDKVYAFNQNLSRSAHETSFLAVGDGLLVITKG